MKTPTRQRLIEAATRRFYRDGFRNVGIDQVLLDVGISKTAFYKHFESKEDLMLAVLERQNVWLQETFSTMIREHGGASPIGQLHAALDVVEVIITSDDFHGCIFVNAAIEFPLSHEPAHIAASENKLAIEDILYSVAVETHADDPRALAQELCLIIEGTYITRHVSSNLGAIDIARRLAGMAIDARCGSR